jgi:hypothetical protein
VVVCLSRAEEAAEGDRVCNRQGGEGKGGPQAEARDLG